MDVKFTDNSEKVKEELQKSVLRALEKCGLVGEGYAKKQCPVDTGELRSSISHLVDEDQKAVYIGTNSEYGPYVELGTGIYAEGGGGRPTPWVYQDSKGDWHTDLSSNRSLKMADYKTAKDTILRQAEEMAEILAKGDRIELLPRQNDVIILHIRREKIAPRKTINSSSP